MERREGRHSVKDTRHVPAPMGAGDLELPSLRHVANTVGGTHALRKNVLSLLSHPLDQAGNFQSIPQISVT